MACEHCINGWLIVERGGYSGAERCPCSIPPEVTNPRRETPLHAAYIDEAISRLGNLKFFPKEPGALTGIAEMISRMVHSQEQLSWLVRTMIDRVGTWHGPMEMRGVFCTRYDPKDGEYACCADSFRFTAEAFESRAALGKAEERKAIAPPMVRELTMRMPLIPAKKES